MLGYSEGDYDPGAEYEGMGDLHDVFETLGVDDDSEEEDGANEDEQNDVTDSIDAMNLDD